MPTRNPRLALRAQANTGRLPLWMHAK